MKKIIFAAICLLVLIIPSFANATKYYVNASTGNDNNNGLTAGAAWATVNKTNTSIVHGDTVYIAPGQYDGTQIIPPLGTNGITLYIGSDANGRSNTIVSSGTLLSTTPANWTQYSGNIYRYNSTIGVGANAWYGDGQMTTTQNNVLLHQRRSLASLTGEGEAYYDTGTDYLYVWARGGGNPATKNIRYSQRPVVNFTYSNQGKTRFENLTLDLGIQGVVTLATSESSDANAPDSIIIINCNVQNGGTTSPAANGALVYSGNPGITSANDLGRFFTAINDTFRYCWSDDTGGAEHEGNGLGFYVQEAVKCSASVFHDIRGVNVNFKNGYSNTIDIDSNIIINNRFIGGSYGIRLAAHCDSNWIVGNTFIRQTNRGISLSSSSGTAYAYQRIFVYNNTFYDIPYPIQMSPIAANSSEKSQVRYNIIYDTANVTYSILFLNQGGEAGPQTPSTESYFTVNNNLYYHGSQSFICAFTSNSGLSGNTWSAWQTNGFDVNGVLGTNPLFNNTADNIWDLSRPSSSNEINVSYLGTTWTRYGAWQPTGTPCETLSPPTLSSPANGATDLTQPIALDWTDVSGATGYAIQVDDNSDFSSPTISTTSGTSNYSASGLANNTTYYWRVSTQNSCGYGSWSTSRSFTTFCVVPSLPTLSSPANGATNQSQPVVLDWTDAANATSYDIQVDNNSDFSSPTISTNVATSTYSASSLSYSTTYYWRVRSLNVCGNSGYTASRNFVTGVQPPDAESLVVSVAASSDDGYVYYDGNATYNSINLNAANVMVGNGGPEPHTMLFNFVLSGINFGATYDTVQLVLVRSNADIGTTVNSRIYVHDINNSPTFSTIADYNARTLSSSYVDWNSMPPLTSDNPVYSPNLASIINPLFSKAGWVSGNRVSVIAKNNASSFETYRRFMSRDGSSTLCAKLRLIKINPIVNNAPSAPTIKYPYASKGTWVNPYVVVYNSTDEDNDALTYSFEISTNSGFTGIVASTSGVAENDSGKTGWRCSPNLSANTVYYARARAYDGTEYSSWSSTVSFFTYPNTVQLVDQNWRDANNGIMSTAGQIYVLTEDINTTKWGFIIKADDIKFDLNYYTITYDNKDSVGITNASFETADTDTNNALGWNMGTNALRKAGNYLMLEEYGTGSPSLYSGSYALAVTMPIDSSITTTSSLYTFAGGYRYNISVMCYNHYANSTTTDAITFRIRLLNASGQSVYMGTTAAGRFYRGFVPIAVEFYTDTTAQYRIGLEVVGGATAVAGNVYFDDARIQTDCYHGISIGIDTTRNNFQATYITGNHSSRIHHTSVYPTMSQAKGLDGVLVQNGTIIQGNGRCFNSMAIYIGLDNNPTTSPCENDTIYNVTTIVRGPVSDNVVIETSKHRLSNMVWMNYSPFGTNRNTFPIAYVRSEFSPYAYGLVIDSSYGGESNGSGIVIQSKCDSDGDGTDDYPLNKIYGVTLQTHTKYTNGFAIMSYGSAGLWVDSSFIYNDTGQFYGLGIQFASETSTCEQRPKISRSIIRCQPYRWSQEYKQYLAGQAKAIQFDNRINFATVEYCTVTVYADDYLYDISGVTNYNDGVCIRRNDDAGVGTGIHINGCKLIAIARGNDAAQCINWYTATTNNTDSLRSMFIENTTFVTNDVWIGAISFSYESLLLNNTFVIDSTIYPLRKCSADHINGFVHNDQNSPVQKIRIIGNKYPDATTEKYFDSLYVKNSSPGTATCSASREASYYLGWNIEVLVLNGVTPEPGAVVTVKNVNNATEYIDTSNIYGYVNTYAYEYYDSSRAVTRDVTVDRTNLNPHTISVVSGSLIASTQITIISDTSITLQLSSSNNAPVLASIGNKSVNEASQLTFSVSATDADGQTTDLYTSTLPTGASFTDNNNNTGSFSWIPDNTQSGSYQVTFYASDGLATDEETITITVNDLGNQAPSIVGVYDRSATENTTVIFDVTVTDPDNSNLPISIQSGLPTGATFTDEGNGHGIFTWVTGYLSAGAYAMTFYTTDGTNPVTAQMVLTITDVNRAPVLAAIGSKAIAETEFLLINITATDVDVDNTLLIACTGYPVGAVFSDNGNGHAQLAWIPTSSDAGIYNNIVFTVTDMVAIDQETISITVSESSEATSVVIYGTVNVEDTWLRIEAPTLNYGNYSQGITWAGDTKGYSLFRFKNIASFLPENAIITNAYISFFGEKFYENGQLQAYRVFKPWVEGDGNGDQISGATYNHFNIANNSLWSLAGCANASDAGADNATSGGGFDRSVSQAGFVNVTRSGFYNLPIITSLVQGWRTSAFVENGILITYTGNIIFGIYTSESTSATETPAMGPKLVIEYTTNVSPNVQRKMSNPFKSILDNGGVF